MRITAIKYLPLVLVIMALGCKNKTKKAADHDIIFKGLYSLGPEAKIFKNCATGTEYWVTDKSAQLELQYWEVVPAEMPNSPVYIEAEGKMVASDKNDDGGHSEGAKDDVGAFDSTFVVQKLIKISKEFPAGVCQ